MPAIDDGPLVIALLGAECTGKSSLAQALVSRLEQRGWHAAWVPEYLRTWCIAAGRTPLAHEQADIAQAQHAHIGQALAKQPHVLVCDTSALVTTAYSQVLFGDPGLEPTAVALHRQHVHASLLACPDLPWEADGLLRDGDSGRGPLHAALLNLLQGHGLVYAPVSGLEDARVDSAWAAMRHWWPALEHGPAAPASMSTSTSTPLPLPLPLHHPMGHEGNR